MRLAPDNPFCRNTLAGILAQNGKGEEAMELLQESESQERAANTNPVTHLLLGWLHYRQGNRDATVQHAVRATQMRSKPEPCLRLLAACAQRGWFSRETVCRLVEGANLDEQRKQSILAQAESPLPLQEWEEQIGGLARSTFFEVITTSSLSPVNRTAWHVLHNTLTPRERDGTLHT